MQHKNVKNAIFIQSRNGQYIYTRDIAYYYTTPGSKRITTPGICMYAIVLRIIKPRLDYIFYTPTLLQSVTAVIRKQ